MTLPPRRGKAPGRMNAQRRNSTSTRTDGDEKVAGKAGSTRDRPRTPPIAGTKRPSTDQQVSDDDEQAQAVDTRAIYEANQEEIEQWYDEDFSRKQGIAPWGKALKCNHPWYQKVNAWMEMKGMNQNQTPRKKRKLNGARSDRSKPQEARRVKPHEIRHAEDRVSVPEYPDDQLSDYTRGPNGRYACSHLHLEPPKQCCKIGLRRPQKMQAIRKEVGRWKARVEKLIDGKQLDKRHKTWTDWTVPELRKKYQPALFEQQTARKKAEAERKRRQDERREKRRKEMADESARLLAAEQEAEQQPSTRRSASQTDPASAHSEPTNDRPMVAPASHPLRTRSIAPMRRRNDPEKIVSAQAVFLSYLARTNPQLLRSHETLYRDAQYHESAKERPDFAQLREWYLAYFPQQQGQPLTVAQRAMLERDDPSQTGMELADGVPALESVNELFGEYLRAAKARTGARPAPSGGQLGPQSLQAPTQQLSQPVTTLTLSVEPSTVAVHAGSSTSSDTYDFDDLFGDTDVTPLNEPAEQCVFQAPFRAMSPDELDSELDRILGLSPRQTTQSSTQTTRSSTLAAEPPMQDRSILPTEVSYLNTVPQAFTTDNVAVDGEMQRMLECAFQTDSAPGEYTSMDGQLLQQTIGDCRPGWQRCYNFLDDEQSLADGSASVEQWVADEFEFDIGETPSEEQLAVFGEFDSLGGQQLFAESDARMAAAQAASLAQCQ